MKIKVYNHINITNTPFLFEMSNIPEIGSFINKNNVNYTVIIVAYLLDTNEIRVIVTEFTEK